MKSYRVEAFVLRRRNLGEADRILTLFSRERGKLDAVAKGARKTTSKFGARLDFFQLSRIELHAGRSLDLVTGATALSTLWKELTEPDSFAFASYVAEAIDAVSEPDLPVEEVFDLLFELHSALKAGIPVARLRAAVDLRLLRALGLSPELDACARCGAPLGKRPLSGGRAALSVHSGGLLCRNCALTARSEPGGVQSLSAAQFATLRAVRALSFAALPVAAEDDALASVTQAFVQYHMGRRSKSLGVGAASCATLRRRR